MNILKKLIPILGFSLIIIVFEIILVYPRAYYLIFVLLISLFFSLYILSESRIFGKNLWFYFLFPSLLMASGFVFLYFLETGAVKQILIITLAFFLWIILKNTSLLMVSSEKGREKTKNIINYLVLIAAFLFFSGLFALRVFLGVKIIWLLIVTYILTYILIVQIFWSNQINLKKYGIYFIFLPFIFIQLFWTITYLPTNFLVNGLILSAVFYVLVNLSRHEILNSLTSKILVSYLILGSLMIIFTALTSQWI